VPGALRTAARARCEQGAHLKRDSLAPLESLRVSLENRAGQSTELYGLNAGIIDKTQFSLLVTVVVLSAVVPTAIAERWFLPDAERERQVDRRLAARQSEEYV
jgi:hypothetical protein